MPQRLPYLLALFFGLLACYGFMAAKAPLAARQYDYISLVQLYDELHISSAPDHFEKVKFKPNSKAYEPNYSALLAKVSELEGQGYELVSSNVYTIGSGAVPNNYILLRRPK